MFMPTLCVVLPAADRAQLAQVVANGNTPQKLAVRASILLMVADHVRPSHIATRLALSRNHVHYWLRRYVAGGVGGVLHDAPRPGRRKRITAEQVATIVDATLRTRPPAATHWSTRTMAAATGLSETTVRRIWHANGLKPHLVKTFKVSNDARFAEKLEVIVGLYLNPPEHAIVLCADEKSQIQALDRTQPGLPIKKGRCGTMTHDYKRNGTATLFAAMDALDGKVISMCDDRHRNQEWLKFLGVIDQVTPPEKELHLIVDNYATHKHPKVQRWLARHPRFHIHFTPTSSSWLNMVERFFRDLTQNRLRRGVFHDSEELIMAIGDYIDKHNQSPKPFIWTAKAYDILEKVKRARRTLDNRLWCKVV